MKRYEMSNREWERIKDKLPAERTGKRGRPAKNNRIMLNGMLWIARTGAQWREMPECYDHGRVSMQDSENGRKMVYGKKFFMHFPVMQILKI
mgnify:CR=1 FL=1